MLTRLFVTQPVVVPAFSEWAGQDIRQETFLLAFLRKLRAPTVSKSQPGVKREIIQDTYKEIIILMATLILIVYF